MKNRIEIKTQLIDAYRRKFTENKGRVFFNKENISIPNITLISPKNAVDFNSKLLYTKTIKTIIGDALNELSFVVNRWSESYVDANGEVQEMVLRGYPMDALKECVRGMTMLFMMLPAVYKYSDEDQVEIQEIIRKQSTKAENNLLSTAGVRGSKTKIIMKARAKTYTKEEKDFVEECGSLMILVAHDIVMSMVIKMKTIEVMLRDSDVNEDLANIFNCCVLSIDKYIRYIDNEILDMNRYNSIVYGKEYIKSEEEIEKEIENSYLI